MQNLSKRKEKEVHIILAARVKVFFKPGFRIDMNGPNNSDDTGRAARLQTKRRRIF